MMNTNKIQRLIIATTFASGLLSAGVAASAQTTSAPASPVTSASNAVTVAMSTIDTKAQKQAELAEINADARRVAFRFLGTSL